MLWSPHSSPPFIRGVSMFAELYMRNVYSKGSEKGGELLKQITNLFSLCFLISVYFFKCYCLFCLLLLLSVYFTFVFLIFVYFFKCFYFLILLLFLTCPKGSVSRINLFAHLSKCIKFFKFEKNLTSISHQL